MRKIFAILLMLLGHAAQVEASTIAGTMRAPNGSPIRNAALNLTLSQAGISPGDFAIVPTAVACATDATGGVVGVLGPISSPVVTFIASGGTVPAATYYVRISYFTEDGTETEASPARQVIATSTGRLLVTAPTVQPASAAGYRVYVGTSTASVLRQLEVTGFGNGSVTAYDSSATPASSTTNNTVCDVTFNDAIIPTFTWYRTSVVLTNGAVAPGFPQNWYLAGSSVNVSTQYPLASVAQQTRFPTPLLATPSSNAQQSVNSPVTLNGYSLTAGSLILPAINTAPECDGTTSLIYTDSDGVLQFCQNGSTTFGFTDWYDTATASVTGFQFLAQSRNRQDPASGSYGSFMFDTASDSTIIASRDYTTPADKALQVEALTTTFVNDGVTTLEMASTGSSFTAAVNIGSSLTVGQAATFEDTLELQGRILGSGATTPVASGSDITLNAEGNFQQISGTTTINCVSNVGWTQGSVVYIQFQGALTVMDGQVCVDPFVPVELESGMDLNTMADTTLTLLYNGTSWFELAHSVN